jgi:ABC-type iron transport system FetAB ATPase subunit
MDKQAEYEKLMIEAIQKYKWNRWSHIDWDVLGFSRPTAYNHELDKLDTIKGAFEQNRSKNVNYLLQNWINSDNATLQIAAMRIVADPEDRQRLNQNYIEMSGSVMATMAIVDAEPTDTE